jgi:redox-sensitive bicupin YhaK (pirin superfamily)
MYKKVIEKTYGQLAPLGPDMKVRRVLPSHEVNDVNPFVFLDHMGPVVHKPSSKSGGTGAHPHKGFCTFTYLLSGEVEHKDSRKHHGIVGAGGVQWMMAASGIVHDEKPTEAYLAKGGILHGFQLWINLPAKYKNAEPQYLPLQSKDIQEVKMGDSNVRVLIGAFQAATSPIPVFSPMFIYHIQLAANDEISIPVDPSFNVFAYVPVGEVISNGEKMADAELDVFGREGDSIQFKNETKSVVDIMLFGGEPIPEPIVAHGPFVMNTEDEIRLAYHEQNTGKYGKIDF